MPLLSQGGGLGCFGGKDGLGAMRIRGVLRGEVGTYGCVVWFGPAGGFDAAVLVVVCGGLAARAASCCWRR